MTWVDKRRKTIRCVEDPDRPVYFSKQYCVFSCRQCKRHIIIKNQMGW